VSTSPDQVAIAPGYLQKDWTKDGRRYFHYAMDSPIPRFFAFQSARYALTQDSWKEVAIQVFHHPGHEYNVPRMVDAVKKTLDYLTTNISPYQHRQVRIVEFPRYTRRAASFPNTIPFSESIGFIARVDGPDAIDYPFYVTAHEVAHQWWGYQVLGADVQGASMLSETMAQYSALMVAKKEFGPARMRRFLRYELDGYLSGRGDEVREETPLELVENQGYIHYRKGSLALYALQDYVGEERLNAALRDYVAQVRFAPPPYTVSRDLLAYVAKIVPPEHPRLLEDLFSTITLYDLAATDASSRRLPDGRYEVTVKARARKLRADGKGVETEVPIDDWIDVGVLAQREADGEERALHLRKERITGPEVTVTVVIDGVPRRAGIDPYHKLIDRTPSDNVRAVDAR
jgi:aminopeptidase N